jgi:hypothetical protein
MYKKRASEKVPINKEEYSESSKRSAGHEYLGEYYSAYKYGCFKCGKKAIYSAIEQKEAYENRKEYMWAKPTLCSQCWKEKRVLKTTNNKMESLFCLEKEKYLADENFLNEWLKSLIEYGLYTNKANTARIEFIKKHLTKSCS